jgi:hypothetical protein
VSDRAGRLLQVSVGLPAGAYALWLLASSPVAQWWSLLIWLAGGVVLHDLVLAPVLIAVGVASRKLPRSLRRPAAVGLVLWGTVTLLAVPVLGRFGARDDNATMLDRPYVTAWLVGCALTVLLVALAGAWQARAARSAPPGKRVTLT